jgi:AP-4 complex subunit beta-1
MSKKLTNYLLANLSNFGELQLPVILNYIELYDPKNDEEIIHILYTLQSKLKSSSASVALSISKIYLKMSKLKPDLPRDIFEAIKSSLLSFLNNDTPEIEFVVLKHIEYIILTFKVDNLFNDYKKFLLGINDPTYLKAIKINILQLTINKTNLADVINEFAEYLLDEGISK